jgi:DNA helicase II / ATP-dependent DNA helicase PcrA
MPRRSTQTITRTKVVSLLSDEERVSAAQRMAVYHEGNYTLTACPGSGKTRTVGLRAAWASVDGNGRMVAATSYTNVAVSEMRRAAVEAGAPLAEPHFVGTLHNFFLRYVYYPFGRLVMHCATRPRVVRESYERSNEVVHIGERFPLPIWSFDFRADGRLVIRDMPDQFTISGEEAARRGQHQARQLKQQLAAQGMASPSDAMHYVQRILEDYPGLAAAVAARFDELIIDEAQDTSDVQLRCLELLHLTGGLQSLVLVGDFDQAIYSFAGASPGECQALGAACRLVPLSLTENFRSSQAICEVTHRFSSRTLPDVARGSHRDFGVQPEFLLYEPRNLARLLEVYHARLRSLGLDIEAARILVRTQRLADQLNGLQSRRGSDNPAVRLLGRAAAIVQSGGRLDLTMVRTVEHLVGILAWGDARRDMRTQMQGPLRDQTVTLVENLPELERPINEWIAEARTALSHALRPLADPPSTAAGRRIRIMDRNDRRSAQEVFATASQGLVRAQTIHSVKGESYDAVLLAAPLPRAGRDHARAWVSGNTKDAEELRIAYVALTRARCYLAVALPNNTARELVDRFLDLGFLLIDTSQ